MKRYLLFDDDGQDLRDAVALLMEHGYKVSQAPLEVDPPLTQERPERIREIVQSFPESACQDINASEDAVLVARAADGLVMDLSGSFSGLTGYGREELLGEPMLGLAFFLDPKAWSLALADLESGGVPVSLKTRILRKDGLVSFVSVNIRNESMEGAPCHVMTIRDDSREMAPTRHLLSGAGVVGELPFEMDINREDMARLIDFEALQDLMNAFYKITRIGIGIIDIKGNVHVATGWQEVCTKFHRIHPETLRNCLESDMLLSQNIREGEFTLYKCRNNLWDIATPIIVGGRHIANIFLGQFFFEDEVPDYELFREQAEIYGFDLEQYLAALDAVPRWSRETVENVMEFYSKLAQLISRLSIGNILLAQALTKQKGISEELQQASLVVENSPVVLFRWRATKGWPVDLVSHNVTQFGYTPGELLSGATPFASMIHTDDLERVVAEVEEYSAKGLDNFQQEYRILSKSGDIHWVYDRTVVERDEKGAIKHYQGIVMDITEKKQSVERMRAALAEKVVLLQELHHRVKNNLQIITSLLDLQSDYINEEGTHRFIRESKNRIRSMALVHEQLYRSGDLSSIDFANYVDDLVNSIFVASVVDQSRIRFNIDVRDVELDMGRAIPCGLIINELVSNAIKYAFPEGRCGTVQVACFRTGDGIISIEISDSGVGLPEGMDFRRTDTMGLQIVNLLTRQLRGRIEMLEADGTAFLITFPVESNMSGSDRASAAGNS